MPFVIALTTPLTIGDYPNQRTVDTVRISAVAINAQHGPYAQNGIAAMALIVEDIATGRQIANPVWKDATSLALLQQFMETVNPQSATSGNTFAQDIIARAQAATDPVSGLTIVPAGTVKRLLTVTPAPASRVVGAANPTFTGTITGMVAGDGITATYASAADASTPVGVYATGADAITATLADPNGKLSGYYVVQTHGALTITAS